MDYSCSNVSFAGKVDKSVYEWVKFAKKAAFKSELDNANYSGAELKKESLDAIEQKTTDILKLLEQKAAVMHPDTVITVDQPLEAYQTRFLCVNNKKLDTRLRQTPASKTNNDSYKRLDRWKVAGSGVDNKFGGYFGPEGKQYLELLEDKINDIDETATDNLLVKNAVEYALECSKSGTKKHTLKQINNLTSVQKDLNMETNWVEDAQANMKAADEKIALRKHNEAMLNGDKEGGFFSKLTSFFK